MKEVIEITFSNTAQVSLKINAFKTLYERDPEISFHGDIEDEEGEICFCTGKTEVLNIDHEREIPTLEIDGEPIDCLVSTQTEGSKIYLS